MSRRKSYPADLAGPLPPGAIVREVRLPERPLAPLQPPGSAVAILKVEGRPVPWSVPPKIRRKNPKLKAWQAAIRATLAIMRGHAPLYPGPVSLEFDFRMTPCFAGSPKGMPDLTNLVKGAEDALNGSLLVDDSQVVSQSSRLYVGDQNYLWIGVYAAPSNRAETITPKGGQSC